MFFKTKIFDLSQNSISFLQSNVLSDGREYADYIDITFKEIAAKSKKISNVCSEVEFVLGFTPSVIKKINGYCEYKKNDEAFAIKIGKKTVIWATKEIGFIYAVSTLLALAQDGELCTGFIYDYPLSDVRGYRAFLPSRRGFDSFRKMIDLLAFYKYNSIILEVGGAMEYKRHPEINERWRKLCEECHSYSGRAIEIMNSCEWHKNCIHCDNAGGDILLQSEVRELVAYCRSRGIEVIPECPTMSHSDYIVMAHPEIAERPEDPYPDTYCPNHPDTYKYVFDILEEVIDVFEPKAINIGHDELCTVSICPRCKNTSAPKLYADDIWKIRNFLKERNINVLMWGEKLLKAYLRSKDAPIGGTGRGEGQGKIPAIYPCRDLLPRDITYLHWYYGFNTDYDKVFLDRKMDTVYGNLGVIGFENWNMRRDRGIHGGFVSNWGSFEEEYMQRNGQYYSLISTAYAFWCDDFEELGIEKQIDITIKELYRLKCEKIKNPIRVVHTTSHKMDRKWFYDGYFIVDEDYILGNYKLTYIDGTEAYLPVKYGQNITKDNFEDYRKEGSFIEVVYSTLPMKINNRFVYETSYENPHPFVAIKSIEFIKAEKMQDVDVELFSIEVCDKFNSIMGSEITKEHMANSDFAY